MADKQRTLKAEVAFSGLGLHTGLPVELKVLPAPENHGYVFQRVDIEGQPTVKAIVENVIDTSRSTMIEKNGARVGTVEHVLSALYGLEIDNALIQIDSAETPILDGSSKLYIDAFQQVGIVDQDADREYFVVKKNISYQDEESGIEIQTFPSDHFSADVMIDYSSEILGHQYSSISSLKEYAKEVATCRTFVFFRDLEILAKKNLIKGGSLDNAIVILEKETSQEEVDRVTDLLGKPRLVAKRGVLNNVKLRFSNEPARHKLLDLIGDLALIGMPIKGKILASRPGHYSNVQFAMKIKQIIKKESEKVPEYDPNKAPLYDVMAIQKLLPHRPPFLLVDKVLSVTNKEVIALKNVTMNEPFFVGHFPEQPVMPGVLICEAMAQAGGVLALSQVPDPENYLTYFMKMDKVKFRGMVKPGDTLIFRLTLMTPIRRGIVNMKGEAFVGDNLVTEGEFMAQITK